MEIVHNFTRGIISWNNLAQEKDSTGECRWHKKNQIFFCMVSIFKKLSIILLHEQYRLRVLPFARYLTPEHFVSTQLCVQNNTINSAFLFLPATSISLYILTNIER